MQWMELTSDKMPQAVKDASGVCLLPMGCLERHGPHLPLGTDQITADAMARAAALIEPAIVFPGYYLSQIAEARHCPGAFSLPNELVLQVLKATLDEIGRNGFTKIIIVNCHGGNIGLLDFLMFTLLQGERQFVVYKHPGGLNEEDARRWAQMQPAQESHAGEAETSLMMHMQPQSVDMASLVGPEDWSPRGKQKHLGGARNPMWWYADYPTHLGGDPTNASAEKGAFLLEAMARHLAEFIKIVKDDQATGELLREYQSGVARGGI
jgi:creatinine amidohydrolase